LEKKQLILSLLPGLIFVFILWLVFAIELYFNIDLFYLGLVPKDISGLKGIIFMPFIHGDYKHLINNSIPLIVLMSFLTSFYKNHFFRVFILIWLISGIWTWTFGRTSYHIGASAIIYGLTSFLFFAGIIIKERNHIAISLLVVFIYGSLIWGILPIDYSLSWEGHLSGFLAGITLAFFYKNELKKSYMKSQIFEDDTDESDENEMDYMQENPIENENNKDLENKT